MLQIHVIFSRLISLGLHENGAANSSWNSVSDIKHKTNETEDKYQRFLLKRNNPDTNPEEIRKKTSDSERPERSERAEHPERPERSELPEEIRKKTKDSERPVQSKHEMMDLLMRGSKKKSKK